MAWKIEEDKSIFTIGMVADILGVKQRTLRIYEERGLLQPSRTHTNRRLYSLRDINEIAYLNYLGSIKKVNLAGLVEIQKVLRMMGDSQRKKFLDEVEGEIRTLPEDGRKLFSDPDALPSTANNPGAQGPKARRRSNFPAD